MAQLEELPNELILFITEFLNPTEILPLSHVSRRFQQLAISAFLAHHGINFKGGGDGDEPFQMPSLDLGVDGMLNLVKGFCYALSISRIEHFHCHLHFSPKFLQEEAPLILHLLSKWKSIDRVSFIFTHFTGNRPRPYYEPPSIKTTETYHSFSMKLIMAAAEKSLNETSVYFDWLPLQGRTTSPPDVSPNTSHLTAAVERKGWKKLFRQRRVSVPIISPIIRTETPAVHQYSNGLEHLQLGSGALLKSNIPIFDIGSLTTLMLKCHIVQYRDWGPALSQLMMPNLRKFSLIEVRGSATVQGIFCFLSRHPTIQFIEHHSHAARDETVRLSPESLPNLTTLIATANQVVQYLYPSYHSNRILKSLTNICLIYEPRFDVVPVFSVKGALAAISRLDRDITLSLDFSTKSSLLPWLKRENMDIGGTVSLDNVRNLEVVIERELKVDKNLLGALYSFLGPLFPRLRLFSLACATDVPGDKIILRGKKAFGFSTTIETHLC
ncbi:hypothetical protein C8J56DRAFT_140648 [Mycena floridula]|nr:hypothetical protein C8J56DRAFT_140648 [Mycena floridula]